MEEEGGAGVNQPVGGRGGFEEGKVVVTFSFGKEKEEGWWFGGGGKAPGGREEKKVGKGGERGVKKKKYVKYTLC